MKQSTRIKKWLIIVAVISLLLVFLLFVGGIILSTQYSSIIKKQLQEQLAPSVKVDFESCKINLLTRSIVFKNFQGSTNTAAELPSKHHIFKADEIDFSGIHIIDFLYGKKVHISKAVLRKTDLTLDKFLLTKSDSATSNVKQKTNFKGLEVDELKIENSRIIIRNDTLNELESTVNITASKIYIPEKSGRIQLTDVHFTLEDSSVDEIFFSPIESSYTLKVKSVKLNKNKNLVVDSIMLNPKYGKFEFARKVGKQIDRFESLIPSLRINNVHASQINNSTVTASGIHFYSPSLKAFRDKRLPFIKENEIPLPVLLFKEIPFKINVDTIRIHQATITYEEFPLEADSSGTFKFKNLQASMYHCTNYDTAINDHIDLDVESEFIDSGLLKASFDFPLSGNKRYTAHGTLSDFNLTTLNSMTEPLAKMRIESGQLKVMDFRFDYDNHSSAGELEINYDDLKILSLTEKESKTSIDKFKSFLLNTFVIAKKKDETTSADKRKGIIEFNRDPNRSIFNYWWKSLFTGVKSSYGLEKRPEKM